MALKLGYYQNTIKPDLKVFERKVFRAIFGPTNGNGEGRIKYNDELYTLYKDSDIITCIHCIKTVT